MLSVHAQAMLDNKVVDTVIQTDVIPVVKTEKGLGRAAVGGGIELKVVRVEACDKL